MKADYIEDIIKLYNESPYRCILIDGPWGVGKSYAINEALKNNNNSCNISMFGMKDAQEIYHEVFFQLVMKDKKGIGSALYRVKDVCATISDKVDTIGKVIESMITEKELFLKSSEGFNSYHFIVIDDLERMNNSIKLEEVFGIVDELKKCSYVKVILVANTKEMSQKECFDRYSEKVIDRTYYITEPPEKVDWGKLKIHHGFIVDFLSKHRVKNLRTLQKAQNLYDDVRLKLKDGRYRDDFYDEIRLACFAIVVEDIDNLYFREPDNSQTDAKWKEAEEHINKLETRVKRYYLQATRISDNMIKILQGYYRNEIEMNLEVVEAEYQIFIHAGEKANYFKSDEELKRVLPSLAEKVRQETDIVKMMRYADEFLIWSGHLQLDNNQFINGYKARLESMFYDKAINGNMEYLTYGSEAFYLKSETNKSLVDEVIESVYKKVIKEYIRYLSEKTNGEQAYQYSYTLRKYVDNILLKDAIWGNVDSLYDEKSFPIYVITEQQYNTSYNIMYVLYRENKEKFLAYCDELKARCDNMATYRIEELVGKINVEKWL